MTSSNREELVQVIRLQETFDKALASILASFTYQQFKACYPSLCSTVPNADELLRPLYLIVMSRLADNSRVSDESRMLLVLEEWQKVTARLCSFV
jgi:hypothetical protein